MRFSVITANYNGGAYLQSAIESVLSQRRPGVELEYIVVDGNSTDNSHDIFHRYGARIDRLIVEADTGPANAINKGLKAATGDIVSWLNADDVYYPGALERVNRTMAHHPEAAFCFGACPIIDSSGKEIRKGITRFKELFFPLSSRFTYQCINYISQPAMFFRRRAMDRTGRLDEGMKAAWDYDFILRLWQQGGAVRIHGAPLSAFRWYEQSISGQNYQLQFSEELACAVSDAGRRSVQANIHFVVRWAIVGIYTLMQKLR